MAKTWKDTLEELEDHVRGLLTELGVLAPVPKPVPVPVRPSTGPEPRRR